MCHKFIKFSFKSNRYNRKRWMGGLHIFRLQKKAFDKVPHRRLLWKDGTHLRIKRNIKELDGRLPKKKGNIVFFKLKTFCVNILTHM